MRQKTLAALSTILLVAVITGCAFLETNPRAKDDYVRNNTVLLRLPNGGTCTGTLTQSPWNGKFYVLTAGHCFKNEPDASETSEPLTGEAESGNLAFLHLLKVDYDNDIAVIDNPWGHGLTIGPLAPPHESVRVIAWGAGVPPYVSCGEILRSVFLFDNDGNLTPRLLSSARIIPGCSGGPMVNEDNELVGLMLVTYTSSEFSNGVPTYAIISFMKDLK